MTDVWSERAERYRASPGHREGADLNRLVEWSEVRPGVQALDVATGGGHVARRLRERGAGVVTVDAAPGMGPDVVSHAEQLPFADGSFDVVTCRIAAHHFQDVAAAVREMARVSRDLVVVEDTLYESDELEEAYRLHDETHVRSYSEDEWRAFFQEAGLEVEAVELFEKHRPFVEWTRHTGRSGDEVDRLRELLGDRIDDEDGFTDVKILLKGRKRG